MRTHPQLAALFILVVTRAFAAAPAVPTCPLELLRLSFSFGNAFDAFSRGEPPDLKNLTGKTWTLTGIASHKSSPFVWGTSYNPTGYEVDNSVPNLTFVPRQPDEEGTSDYYALRHNWGDADKDDQLVPLAAFVPTHWQSYPEIKTTSVTWGHPLFRNDIFASGKKNQLTRSQIRYFCRMSGEGLLCLGEYYRYRDGVLTAEQASVFLLFEATGKR